MTARVKKRTGGKRQSPPGVQHIAFSYGDHHNDKHIKTFIGILLFVVMTFVLAVVHAENRANDSAEMQSHTSNQSHTMLRPFK